MEQLALPPERVRQIRREVNSENLISYLGNSPSFNTPLLDFATEFDLRWCSRFMQQIAKTKRVEGFVLSDESRASTEKAQKNALFVKKHGLPLTRLAMRILEAVTQEEEVFKKAPVERFKLAYWDFETASVKCTKVIYGEHSSVAPALAHRQVDQSGNTQLLGIHTHPRDSLFSPPDDSHLISEDPYNPSRRVLKGAIVVCPDMQLLALATPNSPLISIKAAAEWADSAERNFQKLVGKESEFLDKWEDRFYKKIKAIPKAEDDFLESSSGLPDQEMQAYYKIYYRKWSSFMLDLASVYLSVSQTAKTRSDTKTSRMSNRLLHQFYRDLNLKLYISTNMRLFKEFSA